MLLLVALLELLQAVLVFLQLLGLGLLQVLLLLMPLHDQWHRQLVVQYLRKLVLQMLKR